MTRKTSNFYDWIKKMVTTEPTKPWEGALLYTLPVSESVRFLSSNVLELILPLKSVDDLPSKDKGARNAKAITISTAEVMRKIVKDEGTISLKVIFSQICHHPILWVYERVNGPGCNGYSTRKGMIGQ